MEDTIYRIEKPKKHFQVVNCDALEIAEEAGSKERLALKIFDNSDIMEAYELGNLTFSGILPDDEEGILNEIKFLISQEKYSLVAEYSRDNN